MSAAQHRPGDSNQPMQQEEEGGRLRFSLYALQECLRSALSSIRAHGLRSSLTMLGIVIGVASVICVISLVQGLSQSISQQFQGLGGSTLTLRSYTPMEDQLRGKFNRLRSQDLTELQYRVDGIRSITPIVYAGQRFGAEVRNGPNTANGQLFGTTANYQDVQQIFPRIGRFITDSDDASRRRVVVLGEQMRRDLKLPENPVGQFVQIGNEWFKVVGVMEPRGEMFGMSQDGYLLMPYQTALAVTGVIAQPDLWISFTVDDLDAVDQVRQRVVGLMRRLHRLQEDQPADFVVEASGMGREID
jgi:putative ABC transport system permease protein